MSELKEPETAEVPCGAWYSRPAGRSLLAGIRAALAEMLPDLFGYHAVQAGEIAAGVDLFEGSRISRRFLMGGRAGDLLGRVEALPFDADCIDLLMLVHALEGASPPHQVLREADRVLVPEGHVVIVGFNPFSFMGLMSLLKLRRGEAPWSGHYYSKRRICDWLALLGFDILDVRYVGHAPPFPRERMQERFAGLDRMGARLWRPFGSVYLILARKRLATLTPIRPRWRPGRRLPLPGLAGSASNRGNACLRK